MRLLQAARLSRLGEAATGIEKQDEAVTRYAQVHGHEIVGVAADTDVSGSVPPAERPKLGPWLTEPAKLEQYDEITAAYLDRLGRNARHLAKLRDWCEDHGKRLTVVSPPLHWPPEPDDLASPIIWDVLSRLAEYELAAITKRNRDTQRWLIDNAYLVGRPPFGYRVAPKGEHKTLEPDPELLPYLRGMVDRGLAGTSLTDIGKWLTREGISPPGGGDLWDPKSVGQILRNPILSGRRMSRDGTPRTVLKVDPIIDTATWKRLQEVLDSNPRRRGATSNAPALLTGMVFCEHCRGIMHYRVQRGQTRKDGTRNAITYYRCDGTAKQPSRCKLMVRDDWMREVVEWMFTESQLAGFEMIERVIIPGTGHDAEIADISQDIRELTARYTADDISEAAFDEALAVLRAERARLRELPAEPDQIEEHPTGVSVAEHWKTLDDAGKRSYLLATGVRFFIRREDGEPKWRMEGPANKFMGTLVYGTG